MLVARHAINDIAVTVPDEETWQRVVNGELMSGLESRTGFSILQWVKRVGNENIGLDWYDFDNTSLVSIIARPDEHVEEYERFDTIAICKGVTSRKVHSQAFDITATFLIYTG